MYKILIIDDEILIRELIKKSIDFNALGFEIVGEAKDGRQAMEMIEALHPNLLLLDINIPIINGITLAQSVNKEYPEIQIIILSGYSQFDYAKGAIEAGVLDYLLKPLNNSEFIKALSKAKDVLSNQNQIKKTISDYQNQKLRLDKKELLLKLIESSENYNSLDLYPLTQTGIHPDAGTFQIATILIDRLEELFAPQLEKELWKFAISNIAQEILETSFTSILFQDFDNHIVVLTALDNADSVKVFATSCHHICHAVQKTLNFTVTLGISDPFQGLSMMSDAYHESIQALKWRFLLGNARCIYQDEVPTLLDDLPLHHTVSGNLLHELRSGNYENAYNQVEILLSYPRTREEMVFQAIRILSDLGQCLKEKQIQESGFKLDKMLNELLAFELGVDLKHYVLNCFLEAEELLSNFSETKQGLIVNDAKRYIEQNYMDNTLSLSKIANALFVNSSYLSHLFKQESGSNLSDYLTRVRLDKAKRLLDDNQAQYSLSSIAGMVGYKDEYYFNKCFKKLYGISPKKYVEHK